jgi:hypothetical protein
MTGVGIVRKNPPSDVRRLALSTDSTPAANKSRAPDNSIVSSNADSVMVMTQLTSTKKAPVVRLLVSRFSRELRPGTYR